MGMRPPRMCKRCHNTALPGTSLCTKHAAQPEQRQRGALRKLYWRKLWRVTMRNIVLTRDAQCTHIENGTRCPRLATDIDHVIEAEQWVAQHGGEEMSFFDANNLRGLCHSHHSKRTALEQGFARPQ